MRLRPPATLLHCRTADFSPRWAPVRLSVIIPTLNEAPSLPATLHHLRTAAADPLFRVVASDCNSTDGTAAVAERLGTHVVVGGRCRAEAMNHGAEAAGGDVLLFLHADTLLPPGFDRRIRAALAHPQVVGGAFDSTFDHPDAPSCRDQQLLRFVTLLNRFRFRWGRRFYGDQAIFVRRSIFEAVGGYPQVPLLEDIYFSARLEHLGRTAILQPPVRTSPRRFLERGILRQTCADARLLLLDSFGHRPRSLWDHYNRLNHNGHTCRVTH